MYKNQHDPPTCHDFRRVMIALVTFITSFIISKIVYINCIRVLAPFFWHQNQIIMKQLTECRL